MWRLACSAGLALACASGAPPIPAPIPAPAAAPEAGPPGAALPPAPADGALDRDGVDRVLDAGLGRFLALWLVEPYLEGGRFRGWRVVRGPSGAVAPGDVVLRVNGRGIERPAEALDAWEDARRRDEIVVEILREGRPSTLRFPIRPRR